ASRPSSMELSAPSRQSPGARARRPAPRRGAELRDDLPLHERAGALACPQTAPARRLRGRAVRNARDTLVRSRSRARPLALGLSSGLACRAYRERTVAKASVARRARRPLEALLPLAVVSRRDRRGPHPRPVAGFPETRSAARSFD